MTPHGACGKSRLRTGLPLGEEEFLSLQWGLWHQEAARLSFCLANAGARTLLDVCAPGAAAGWVSKSCAEGKSTAQFGEEETCSTGASSLASAASLPEEDQPQLPVSVAPSGFQRAKQMHNLPCHSRPHTVPTGGFGI